MAKPAKKKAYSMPFIKDKDVFKAVMFARKLRKDMEIELAISRAAKHYGVTTREVAHYLGKMGAMKKAKNAERESGE